MPSQLLQNRPDIRQAERQIQAAGLDIAATRARFYPALTLTGTVGYEAFNPRYLVITPEALVGNIAGQLVAPLINKRLIQADYRDANAQQLQAIYNYQRTVLNAFIEVINRLAMEQNYRISIQIKKEQLRALEASVANASSLFQAAQAEYLDVPVRPARPDAGEDGDHRIQARAALGDHQRLPRPSAAAATCSPSSTPTPRPPPRAPPLGLFHHEKQ